MSETQREYYDEATEIGSDPFHLLDRDNRNHRKKQRIILDTVAADAGDRILEVGCGGGIHAPRYARRFEYAGVDISPSLVERTRERVDEVTDSWTVMEADAMDLPWGDGEFSAVVGTAILHHLDDPRAALTEWLRVTEAGGSVTLMEPNYYFPKDYLETRFIEAERNKVKIRPGAIGDVCDDVTPPNGEWTVEPHIYTLPWPSQLHAVYDRIDAVGQRLPGARWLSMMLLIHIEV